MSDETMKVGIGLEVETRNTDDIRKLEASMRSLDLLAKSISKSMRQAAGINTSTGRGTPQASNAARMAREALGVDRDRLRVLRMQLGYESKARSDAEKSAKRLTAEDQRRHRLAAQERTKAEREESTARARSFRENVAFSTRMAKLRAAEDRAAEREREKAERTKIRLDNYRMALRTKEDRRVDREDSGHRRDARSQGRAAVSHGADAYHRLTRPPAVAAAAGFAGTAALARRALSAETDIDAAEINARIYGNLSKEAARALRDKWASPLAETLGVETAKLLTSYTDALKIGIPAAGARQFSELATKTSEAWSVPFETVVDTLGTVNSILTSTGSVFSFDKIKSVANTIQYLAAKQSTTPEKLVQFLKQGAGGAQVLGMSQESGLAFGSASTSLGNQPGESGRLLDYIASRVIEMPNLVKKKGDEGKQARDLMKALGYGTANAMDQARRANPETFLADFMERFARITDPKKQDQALRFFTGREWLGEFGRMVKGVDTYREAVKLANEAKTFDAIEDVWSKHKEKLSVILKRIRVGFVNILGEAGKVFSPLAANVSEYFLSWSRKLAGGGLQARVRAVVDGLIGGFGFKDLPDMLAGVFGKPGEGDAGAISTWKNTAREFAAGIRDVFGSIKAVLGAFTGGDTEVIARWTGRILALSAALLVLSPVLTVIGGLAAIIQTVAASVGAVAALKGISAGGIAGAAVWTAVGGVIGAAFLATVANKHGILNAPDASKGYGRAFLEFLDPGLASRVYGDGAKPERKQWVDPPTRKAIEGLKESVDENAKVLKQSFQGPDSIGRLIHKASISTTGTASALRSDISGIGAAYRSVPLSGSVGAAPLSESAPGSPINGGSGLSRRGIIGGGSVGSGETGGNVPAGVGAGIGARGGSRSWRNNNPGNIEYGPFAKSMGATGSDGRFAIFPDYKSGRNAQEKLLFESKSYRDLTLGQAIRRWAPASENNVPAYVAALGGDSSKKMRDYTPEERGKIQDLMQRHEGWKVGIPGVNAGGNSSILGGGAVSQAAQNASRLVGMGSSQVAQALGKRMTPGSWCADFVNGALSSSNIKGTNSSIANSFLGWGRQVLDGVKSGDVLVEHRGRGQGAPGGHVGLATGETRIGPRGLQLEQISGNHGNRVARSWVDASRVAARRAAETTQNAAETAKTSTGIGDGFTSSGWKRSEAGSLGKTAPLGSETPLRNVNTLKQGGAVGGDGASTGTTLNAPITINGAGQDAASIANAVQRRLREEQNRRTTDVMPDYA